LLIDVDIFNIKKISLPNWACFSIVIFIIYIVLLALLRGILHDELLEGLRWVSRVSIPMIIFLIGFYKINTLKKFHILNKVTLYTAGTIILYLLFVNIFGIGYHIYSSEALIRTGLIRGVGMNTLSFIILLAPVINFSSLKRVKKRLLIDFIFLLLFLVVLIVLRRSAILIVIIGYVIYYWNLKIQDKRFKKQMLWILFAIICLSPLYSFFLTKAIEIRGSEVISIDTLEQDTRKKEIPYIINDTIVNSSLSECLFGKSFNNTGAFPLAYFKRELHSDISNLLYITGVIGLLLYLFFHYKILHEASKLKKNAPKIYYLTIFVLILSSVLLMYSGRLDALTFNSIKYIYMGSILALLKGGPQQFINLR
jgi:hypothetical protein